eukprot:CAMPEP_0170134788 /NCGR_PEP_ID=MMETSP0033_2-20121228/2112_1 /TAXON_ID=195969 /ORGANISM="Dolichomastix tenuilepis, Strain CCMP3274" /LENGTH=405 /DNA_ID=CAMNT_0010370359 /DNA_START=100 /DNA_END=1313 /DNA_ORIENTATION=+
MPSQAKKLTRAKSSGISIREACNDIVEPSAPLSLRLQALLMSGIVTLYERKLTFVFDDCSSFRAKFQSFVTTVRTDKQLLKSAKRSAKEKPDKINKPSDAASNLDLALDYQDLYLMGTSSAATNGEEQQSLGSDFFVIPIASAPASPSVGADFRHRAATPPPPTTAARRRQLDSINLPHDDYDLAGEASLYLAADEGGLLPMAVEDEQHLLEPRDEDRMEGLQFGDEPGLAEEQLQQQEQELPAFEAPGGVASEGTAAAFGSVALAAGTSSGGTAGLPLPPSSSPVPAPAPGPAKPKRKRIKGPHPVTDIETHLAGVIIKDWLEDTSDIVVKRRRISAVVVPPSITDKWIEQLFRKPSVAFPGSADGRPIPELQRVYDEACNDLERARSRRAKEDAEAAAAAAAA